MPLYEYKCNSCDETFEVLQRISAEPLTQCIHCKGDVEKMISVSSFQFKGSGWYITDYKSRKSRPESSSSAKASTTAAASSSENAST